MKTAGNNGSPYPGGRPRPVAADMPAGLPPVVAAVIDAARRRIRQIVWQRGLLAVLSVGGGSALATMALDVVLPTMPDAIRLFLTCLMAAATCAAAWRYLIRPLRRRITSAQIARAIETGHPELEERLSTTVEMCRTGAGGATVSRRLVEEVARAAAIDAAVLKPRREFTYRSAKPWIYGSLGCAAVLLAAGLIFPHATLRLLTRAFVPYADVGNLYAGRLSVEPGDARIPLGDPVTIRVRITDPSMQPVYLHCRGAGRNTLERMPRTAATNNVLEFSLPLLSLDETLHCQVRAGYARSDWFTLTVEPRPAISRLTLRYEFPAYTGWAPATATNAAGDIRVLCGTKVTIEATPSKPLQSAALVLGDERPVAGERSGSTRGAGYRWSLSIGTNTPATWRFDLKDAWGFGNAPETHAIEAIADAPPTVTVVKPEVLSMRVRPTELIELAAAVGDDVGISGAELAVTQDNARPERRRLEAPTPVASQPGIWMTAAQLNLAEMRLAEGSRVRASFRVSDNRPEMFGGPQIVESPAIILQLDRKALSWDRQ
ncbi:MAG: DUF4175 family protein, partial [bacterium]